MLKRGLIREYSSLLNFALRVIDWLAIVSSGVIAYYAYDGPNLGLWPMPTIYIYALVIAFLISTIVFPHFNLYQTWRGASLFYEARLVVFAWVVVMLSLTGFAMATKTGHYYSRMWTGIWFLGGLFTLMSLRLLLRLFVGWLRSRGYNHKKIVIVGCGELGEKVAQHLTAETWAGLDVMGVFCEGKASHLRVSGGSRHILGDLTDLVQFIQQHTIDQIWLAMPLKEEDRVKSLLYELRHCTANIRFVPDIFGFCLLNHSITEVAGLPIVNLSVTPMEGLNLWLKAAEDQILALIILVLMSPFMLLIAIGVKLSSSGPVFYRQVRVSWNGKPFVMLKFRTMCVDSEEGTGPVWAKPGASRATQFGALLRKTSLDELPQFINVLRGDMSIVGPRPERPVFVEQFKDEIPDYMKKHMVKAGITGWAQVNGWRGDTDLKKRIEHDLYYIENWSVWFDIKIILLSIFKGFVHQNAY
jgi:putative colanic acid biosynthesis UDP-glucose lipid carrier transferase